MQGLRVDIATIIACVFGWSCWHWQTPREYFTFKILYGYNVHIRSIKELCSNPFYTGIARHEYLKCCVGNTMIINHNLIEGFPNHNHVATTSNCLSYHSIIRIIYYLLSQSWHNIVIILQMLAMVTWALLWRGAQHWLHVNLSQNKICIAPSSYCILQHARTLQYLISYT